MLTEEQIRRRKKANAERSRRRRAMETPQQRAERNRRTAERMRIRRAKLAEERQMNLSQKGGGAGAAAPTFVRQIVPLSSARFEEIFAVSLNIYIIFFHFSQKEIKDFTSLSLSVKK